MPDENSPDGKTPLERIRTMFDPTTELERRLDRRLQLMEILANNIRTNLPKLQELDRECAGTWGAEDHFYRYYHHSFKVFYTKDLTQRIVEALKACAPPAEPDVELSPGRVHSGRGAMNKMFMAILEDGDKQKFTYSTNDNWEAETRPVLEAFFHARFFLDLAIKYSDMLLEGRRGGAPGYVCLLGLYSL